jgi:hypothetical protein
MRATTMTARIADEIADWAKEQDRWTPVPADDEIGEWLEFVASADTVQAAKRALAELGVFVKDGGRFYVAVPDGSAARTEATGGRP